MLELNGHWAKEALLIYALMQGISRFGIPVVQAAPHAAGLTPPTRRLSESALSLMDVWSGSNVYLT